MSVKERETDREKERETERERECERVRERESERKRERGRKELWKAFDNVFISMSIIRLSSIIRTSYI